MPAEGTELVEIRRGVRDRFGDVTDSVVVAQLKRCIVWPRASSDVSSRGITTTQGHNVWVPMNGVEWEASVAADKRQLLPSDQVYVRGAKEQIDGQVGDWRKKNGERKGYLFETKTWASS